MRFFQLILHRYFLINRRTLFWLILRVNPFSVAIGSERSDHVTTVQLNDFRTEWRRSSWIDLITCSMWHLTIVNCDHWQTLIETLLHAMKATITTITINSINNLEMNWQNIKTGEQTHVRRSECIIAFHKYDNSGTSFLCQKKKSTETLLMTFIRVLLAPSMNRI